MVNSSLVKEEVNNLLIVGNGFDIGHGMKTQYGDFLDKVNKVKISAPKKDYANKYVHNEMNVKRMFENEYNMLFGTIDEELESRFHIKDFYDKELGNEKDVEINIQKFKQKNKDKESTFLNVACRILETMLKYRKGTNTPSEPDESITLQKMRQKYWTKWFLVESYINNSLIEYFMSKRKPTRKMGNKWIDIEAEIAHIIKCIP